MPRLLTLIIALSFLTACSPSPNPSQAPNTPSATTSINTAQEPGQPAQEENSQASEASEAEKPTATSSNKGAVFYPVVYIVDGDTFDVSIDGKTVRIRPIGIDTPETVDPRKSVQCFGLEASRRAHELLDGRKVWLETDPTQGDRDKYKRLLRFVFLEDGADFGLTLIKEGYAHEYTYSLPYKYQKEYKQAETEARQSNRGLWAPDACAEKTK